MAYKGKHEYALKVVWEVSKNISHFKLKNNNQFIFGYGLQTACNKIGQDPCTRICQANSTPYTCYYKFKVEKYYTLSRACFDCPNVLEDCFRPGCIPADGVKRLLTVINRKMPGPGIQVCLGDTVIVDVLNEMTEEVTSVHWHGHRQEKTPYMDGVPFITQCPIAPSASFRYKFKAELAGTHFYHSHTGSQRADGLQGPFTIRQPKSEDIHRHLYDYDLPEHVILITDWIHESGIKKYISHYHGIGTNQPDNILVNGFGKYGEFQKGKNFTPLARFNVTEGKRYRFRVINAGVFYCPVEISVDNHSLTLISNDGGDIKPVHAESLITYAGERWDVIINANNSIRNYWMKFKGLKDCDKQSVFSVAVLHYQGANNMLPESTVTYKNINRTGMQVNPVNAGPGKKNFLTIAELESKNILEDPALKTIPDIVLTLALDIRVFENSIFHKKNVYKFRQVKQKFPRYLPQINNISMKMPSFPVLTEPEYITSDTFCFEKKLEYCTKDFCFCPHTIELPLHSTVEVIFVDEGKLYESNHPFHLHGHSFRVVALDKLNQSTTMETVLALSRTNRIHRNLKNPPIKDTTTVPAGGYTIIRFYTKNPGYWLLHCHLDFHVESGMAVLLKIGNTSDIPGPPANFPRCGSFYHADAPKPLAQIDKNFSNNRAVIESAVNHVNEESEHNVMSDWRELIQNGFSRNRTSSNFGKHISFFVRICFVFYAFKIYFRLN